MLTTELEHNIKRGKLFKKDKVDGQIISGTVTNSATAASFKDVVIQMTYFSKTGTIIEKNNFVIYEIYAPGITKSFSYKIDIPGSTSKYHAEIFSAQRY